MAKKKNTEAKKRQRARKRQREAHLSPEILKSFKAINRWIDKNILCDNAKKKKACAKVRANRRKLIQLSGMQNHRCCYCGVDTWHSNIIDYKTNRSESNKATLEHLLPNSQGGTFRWENLAMACSECNTARGDLPIPEFLASIQAAAKPKAIKSKDQLEKDRALEKAHKTKAIRSERNRFRLLMIASWMYPEDYQRIMNNETAIKYASRAVLKGGKRPTTTSRKHLMKQIRRRVIENRMIA